MLYYILVGIFIFLDQLSKYFAIEYLKPIKSFPLWKGVFHLTYAENTGAAFSIFRDKQLFLILITMVIIAAFTGFLVKQVKDDAHWVVKLSLSMIVGGAIGNLIDRIRLDFVVDYFDFTLINFAIFNVADSFVVVGSILLAYAVIFMNFEI